MNNPKQVTINQLTALMDFLEEHPALALGQFQRSKEGRCLSRRLWEQCALALNALEAGSTRDAEGWREYFKAYKARFKKILSNHQKSLNATGGGPPAVLQLTPLQERLHAILGVDMGEPLPGVQHNPLSSLRQNWLRRRRGWSGWRRRRQRRPARWRPPRARWPPPRARWPPPRARTPPTRTASPPHSSESQLRWRMRVAQEVLLLGARITASLFVIHVVIVPLVFKYSKAFRRILIFANFVQWPFIIPEPNKCGLVGARNLSVKYKSKVDNCSVKIGVWHVLPKTAYERLKDSFEDDVDKTILDKEMDEELASGRHPVVMYCHGNANNRATAHRAILYKLFQDMDYHTITFDYRGYGDSTRINPTEAGVVEDSLKVYEWLLNTAHKYNDNTPVFIWGHSLGTGISSALLGNLTELSRTKLNREVPLKLPNGLILEAPFNNIADEVHHYPLSKLVAWLPYYEMTIVEPFRAHAEQRFRSDVNLTLVRDLPIMILHAKDDTVVPFLVGRKLYKSIVLSRTKTDAPVVFHAYEKKENLGHKYICLAKDLQEVVGDFVKKHQERK